MSHPFFIHGATRNSIQIAFNDVTANVAHIIKTTNTTHVEARLHWTVVEDALKDEVAWWAELHELLRAAYQEEGTFTFSGAKLLLRLDAQGQPELVVDAFLVPQGI